MQEKPALKIVYRQVADLIPYARNARTHSDEQVTRIASSIKEFGFTNPILIDGDNGIIAGHGRLMAAQLVQKRTQSNAGGLTDAYLDMGTYRKSFYSVMYCPSAVKISTMGETHKRIHHHIDWNKCVPKIISPKYRK